MTARVEFRIDRVALDRDVAQLEQAVRRMRESAERAAVRSQSVYARAAALPASIEAAIAPALGRLAAFSGR